MKLHTKSRLVLLHRAIKSDRQAALIQATNTMNMQIHDWTVDEIDISLTALPATDSSENRSGRSHTHTHKYRQLKHTHGVKRM